MKNLNEGYEILKNEGFFIYSLKFKNDNKNQKYIYSKVKKSEIKKPLRFLNKVDFDKKMKNFIFENSVLLSDIKNSIFAELNENKCTFYLSVVNRKKYEY